MGNDGGSIPTRRELVKEAARNPTTSELKESQQEAQAYYWTHDPVSRKPLAQPVVSDAAGKLYNKDTILEFLLDGSRKADVEKESHGLVKGLKDVVEVRFEVDGEAAKDQGEGAVVVWKCPVTGSRLGPGSKAVYLVPCGHAFSGSAIKEISGEKCLTCDTEYASNDVIPILPTSDTDLARLSLRTKTLAEKGLTHSLKKASSKGESKKRKKTHDSTAAVASSSKEKATATAKSPELPDEGKINNSATASLTAKVLHEQEDAKKRKLENKNVRSLFSNRDGEKHHGKSSDFMTRGFSVPAGTKK